ncbi:TadE/TadG family type IV pilus assembly protein, partial [Singulisphaera rosea]
MLVRISKKRIAAARKGASAVVVAICLVPLIGVMAFAIEGGLLMAQRRQVQA